MMTKSEMALQIIRGALIDMALRNRDRETFENATNADWRERIILGKQETQSSAIYHGIKNEMKEEGYGDQAIEDALRLLSRPTSLLAMHAIRSYLDGISSPSTRAVVQHFISQPTIISKLRLSYGPPSVYSSWFVIERDRVEYMGETVETCEELAEIAEHLDLVVIYLSRDSYSFA